MCLAHAKTNSVVVCLLALFVAAACGGSSDGSRIGSPNTVGGSRQQSNWLIPVEWVADGGPGVDGIPAIQNPEFESAATNTSIQPDDLVIVVRAGGQVKAYPEDIMDYHEIVNDGPASDPFVISYCPLTGSALAWKSSAADADPTFGVSGLLYNSNLLLYDRETRSIWSQLLQRSVNGSRTGERRESIQVLETTFETLKSMYPDALVMTRDTGHVRDYDDYPYGDYREISGTLFRVSKQDNRLPAKLRVIGLHIADQSKVYRLGGIGAPIQTIHDQFFNRPIVVVGNSVTKIAAIYNRTLADGTILTFDPIQNDLPNVMVDTEGNVWDVFGTAVSGPRLGTQLDSMPSYTAMWFAWVTHFEIVEIYD